MEWTNYMNTGANEIDDQHKELFKYLNEIGSAVRGKKGAEKVGKILKLAGEYAVNHFAFEEALAKKNNHILQTENKRAHEKFISEFGKMVEQFEIEGGSLALGIKVHRELTNWLFDHIIEIDKKMLARPKPQ